MSRSAWAVVARHLEAVAHTGTLAACSDAQLLDRFRRHRDEAAFGALVQGHGPMVRAVCRRIVADPHTADDAFQATFLVLARRAGSVRDADRLGPWLHRVAVRVATRAAQDDRRRQRREVADSARVANAPAPVGPDPDRSRLLHEELDRLPDRYRLPVLLCDLQRLTHEEAAARLGWPVGTVKGRQARARDRLRDRLTRRGLAAPLALVTATLATDAKAVLPAALAARTATVALNALTGASATVTATAAALTLSQGVQIPMWFSPLKLTAVAALLGGGLIVTQTGSRPPAQDPARPPGSAPAAAPTPAGGDPAPRLESDPFAGEPAGERSKRRAPGEPAPDPAAGQGGMKEPGPRVATSPRGPGRGGPGPDTARPISDEERDLLERELELAEIDEELLEEDLNQTRNQIASLLEAIGENRLTLIQQAAMEEGDSQRALKATTERLDAELQEARSALRKGLGERRQLRTRQATARRSLEAPSDLPVRFKPGDAVVVEMQGNLAARMSPGIRRVRPDGTISLDFYGDVQIAGLDRQSAKVAVIRHLQDYLSESDLGLVRQDDQGDTIAVDPVRSAVLYIREASDIPVEPKTPPVKGDRIDALERRLDEVLRKLDQLQPGAAPKAGGFEGGGGGFGGGGGGGFR